MCDRRLLDFHGAPLHAANLSDQPAFSDTADMGTSVSCDVAFVSSLVRADTAPALARSTISVGASQVVAKLGNTSTAEWTSGAGAHRAATNRDHCSAQLVSFVPVTSAAYGAARGFRCDGHHGLLGHCRRQSGRQLLSQIPGTRIQARAGATPFSEDAIASTFSLQHTQCHCRTRLQRSEGGRSLHPLGERVTALLAREPQNAGSRVERGDRLSGEVSGNSEDANARPLTCEAER